MGASPGPTQVDSTGSTSLDTPVPTPPMAQQQPSGNGVANGNGITKWCMGTQPYKG